MASKKKTTKKTTKSKYPKLVSRKFMLDLADKIYNQKTKKYLNLCEGTLSNGPDPLDGKRTMHCGLGELYFEMTGSDPAKGISESDIVEMAVENSTLYRDVIETFYKCDKIISKVPDKIIRRNFRQDLAEQKVQALDIWDDYCDPKLDSLTCLLGDIPYENDSILDVESTDDGESDKIQQTVCYRDRSKRVAAILRKAAKLLPK